MRVANSPCSSRRPRYPFSLEGVAPRAPLKRKHESSAETEWHAEFAETDFQAELAELRILPVRPAQTIPKRKRKSEIRVGLDYLRRVMDAMHVGRHHKAPKPRIDSLGDVDVPVIEERRSVQENLERNHRPGNRT